jgi:hypothetical protein
MVLAQKLTDRIGRDNHDSSDARKLKIQLWDALPCSWVRISQLLLAMKIQDCRRLCDLELMFYRKYGEPA